MSKKIPSFLLDGLFNLDYDSFVELLYKNQKFIDSTNENNESLLHYSSYYGLVDKFIILLNMGAKLEKTINNDTLLHYSSLGGKDYYLFHSLIKDENSLLLPNNFGLTPFHLCSNVAMSSLSYRFLEMKNLKFKLSEIVDYQGNNPAHIAAQNNHIEVLQFLTQQDPTIVESKNIKGETPLTTPTNFYQVCTLN